MNGISNNVGVKSTRIRWSFLIYPILISKTKLILFEGGMRQPALRYQLSNALAMQNGFIRMGSHVNRRIIEY